MIEHEVDTRQRLLDAARAVFAEHGYRHATVREICQRAGANVAAIHYHFGDKEALYLELFRELGSQLLQRYPPNLGLGADASVDERLFAFVHSFLLRILGDDAATSPGRLFAREMVEPTPVLDQMVEEIVRPLFKHLCGIVAELLGPSATPDEIVLCARSVVAQCVFYQHSRPVIERLSTPEPCTPERIRALAEHITRFSLEGLRRGHGSARSGA